MSLIQRSNRDRKKDGWLNKMRDLLWYTLDDSVKNEPTLSAFKKRIKDWAGDKRTSEICR